MAEPDPTGPECPQAGRVLAYLRGELATREAEELETHYFACDRCWQEVERGLEIRAVLKDGAAANGAEASASRVISRRRLRSAWAAAAAVALLAVGLWRWAPGPPKLPDELVLRGNDSLLEIESALTSAGLSVRWPAVPSAKNYLVQLLAGDSQLIFEWEIAETSLVIPRARLPLAERTPFSLKVQALDELRQVVATSPQAPVTIPPVP